MNYVVKAVVSIACLLSAIQFANALADNTQNKSTNEIAITKLQPCADITSSGSTINRSNILIISTFDISHKWSNAIIHTIGDFLNTKYPNNSIDSLDLNSIRSNSDYSKKFNTYLEDIKSGKYDVIVSILDNATNLLIKNLDSIPQKTAIITCGRSCDIKSLKSRHPATMGVYQTVSLKNTVRLGLNLMPDSESVLIITDSYYSGNIYKKQAEEFKRQTKDLRVMIVNSDEYSTSQMLNIAESMPKKSFIIFTPWREFAKDGYSSLISIANEMHARARVPFLIVTDVLLEHGALGGNLTTGNAIGLGVTKVLEQILSNPEKASEIKNCEIPEEVVIDMKVAREFGLNAPAIKNASTKYLNEIPDFTEKYRDVLICASIASVVLLALLLAYIFILRRYKNLQRQISTIFNYIPLRIFVVDKSGNVLFKQAKEFERTRIDGGNIKKAEDLPLENRNLFLSHINKSFEDGSEIIKEYEDIGKNRIVHFKKLPRKIFGKDSVIWYSTDITSLSEERKRRIYIEEQNKVLLNTLDEGTISTDDKLRITLMNDAAQTITRRSLSEVIGKDICDVLNTSSKNEFGECMCASNLALKDGNPHTTEDEQITLKDGSKINICQTATPIRDKNGKILGVITIFKSRAREVEQNRSARESNTYLSAAAKLANMSYLKFDENMKLLKSSVSPQLWPQDSEGRPLPIEEWAGDKDKINFINSIENLRAGNVSEITVYYSYGKEIDCRYYKMRISATDNKEKGNREFWGIVQDITELKNLEIKQNKFREILSGMLDGFPCPIYVKDYSADGVYILSNKANSECIKIDNSKIVGFTDEEIFPKEIADEYRRNDIIAIESLAPLEISETIILPDNTKRFLHCYKIGIRNSAGHKLLIGAAFDITELILTQKMMTTHTSHEELLKTILEELVRNEGEMSNVDKILEKSGKYMKADCASMFKLDYENRILIKITDWKSSDKIKLCNECPIPGTWLNGQLKGDIIEIEDIEKISSTELRDTLRGHGIKSLVSIPVMADGKLWGEINFNYTTKHIFCESERVILKEIANIAKIAVERIHNMDKLKLAIAKAKNAAKAKATFLATMSHEIRTPLNAVIGFGELAKSRAENLPDNDELRQNIDDINFSANSLLHLINDILDLSKLEADHMEITPTPVNVEKFIIDTMRIFKLTAQKKGISTPVSIQNNIPVLMLDIRRMRQIMINIIGNAMKFTNAGFVSIDVSYAKNSLVIKIEDTGIGISQEYLKKIFNPFTQAPTVGNHTYEGTGLGLAISDRLVRIMGGTIDVQSELSKGSKFTIVLNNIIEAPNAEAANRQIDELHAESFAIFDGSGKKLMIVDDIVMNLKLLNSMTTKMGFETVACSSAEDALKIILATKPDAILTDLRMPDMDGVELLRRIKSSDNTKHIPVCVVTADAQFEDRNRFDAILIKPITKASLSDAFYKIFGRKN